MRNVKTHVPEAAKTTDFGTDYAPAFPDEAGTFGDEFNPGAQPLQNSSSAMANSATSGDDSFVVSAPASSVVVDPSTYPYDCVCYIQATFAGAGTFRGSGVIIGPHTVLTASHVVWNSEYQEADSSISVYPGDLTGPNGVTITGANIIHYYQITYTETNIDKSQSEFDFAIIDFATSLASYGSFGIETNYLGGTVHLTGYPAETPSFYSQTDETGTVTVDPDYSVLDYGSDLSTIGGNSGGPLWINLGTTSDTQPYVVGVVSSTADAVQLTSSDWQTIQGWESDDSYLWNTPIAPTINTQSFSVTENQFLVAVSSYVSLSTNSSTDSITSYWIEDVGGGTGHLAVSGITEPDNQWLSVNTAWNNVQYVGGSAVGTDTLDVAVYDATTGSYIYNTSNFTATTTAPHIAPTVTAVPTVSVSENEAIAASSLISSITNPSGDSITLDIFKDNGGGSGYFTVNGVPQPDGSWIYPNPGDTVDYVGGSSPGTDTLDVGIYDYTTNSYSYAPAPVAATTQNNFDGSGISDILWRNSSGSLAEWLMNGSTIELSATPTYQGSAVSPGSSWSVAGIGDFNGDGDADILWRNSSGSLAEWLMNGSTIEFERNSHLSGQRRLARHVLERRRNWRFQRRRRC